MGSRDAEALSTGSPIEPCYRYAARLNRIIDGDTAVLDVDLGFRVFAAITVRLRGADTPELPTEAGVDAKNYSYYLLRGRDLVVQSYHDRMSFSRWVCDVYVDGDHWADRLIKAGHGNPA